VIKSGIHYSLDDFSSKTPDDDLNRAEAVFRKTKVPISDGFRSPILIWAIYGSGREFWRSYKSESKVPLLIHGTSSAFTHHGWEPPGRVELGADNSLGFTHYEARSDGYRRGWRDELHCALILPDVVEQWREPFHRGFVMSTFSVERSTNIFGFRVTLLAIFVDRDPPLEGNHLIDYSRVTFNLKQVFLEPATRVQAPEIRFFTMIHDLRFTQPDSPESISAVSYMTNRCLSLDEAQMPPGYRSSRKFSEAARRRLNLNGPAEVTHSWGRRGVLYGVTIMTSIVFMICMNRKRLARLH